MRAADDDTPDLPEDPAALRALLLTVLAERDAVIAERDTAVRERDALTAQNERLQHLLLKLRRRQFGTKSERLPEDQLLFAFEEIEATLAGNAAEAGKASPALRDKLARRRREGRGRLPAHLPRIEQVLAPGPVPAFTEPGSHQLHDNTGGSAGSNRAHAKSRPRFSNLGRQAVGCSVPPGSWFSSWSVGAATPWPWVGLGGPMWCSPSSQRPRRRAAMRSASTLALVPAGTNLSGRRRPG